MNTSKIRTQEINWNTVCLECPYLKECEKHNGKYSEVEGCHAIAGTHFCKLSWEPFFEDCKNLSELQLKKR